ncbi:MAG: ABC transporter substrate-binding protein [Armatimonadetes bacterium]|nr:ABC transporter substrate-binding protein [Armatimonadota bacterium]
MNRLGVWSAVFVAAVLSVGCGGPSNFSERRKEGEAGVLKYPIKSNPTTLDPAIVQDGDTIDILQNVYEGLVGWDENNQPVGYLAEKWDVKDNGKTWVFHLRKGVKFSNGRELTADDVKFSIERACDPQMKSQTADAYMNDIVGVTDMVNGKAKGVAGVKVIDPSTVEIDLNQPTPYFLGRLTYIVSAVVPKESVPTTEIKEVSQCVGTGPFKIKEFHPNQLLVLEANPGYWGTKAKLSRIERPVIIDAQTRLNKYKNGELDMLLLERQDVNALKKDPVLGKEIVAYPRPSIYYVAMNQLVNPQFKDLRVRQAFAMGIDRDKIVNELLEGLNEKADSIVPPGVKGHRDKAAVYPYDVAKAKELLAQAGFPGGKGLPPFTLTFRDGQPDVKVVAEAVASQLNANLGLDIKLQVMEWRAYLEKFNHKEQGFYHMRWAADYLDPQNFLSQMLATWGPENKLGYNNAEFDKLCRQGDTTLDYDARVPFYQKAEDVALQDVAWIPIYFQKDYELHKPGVNGLRESLFGHLQHTTTSITR